MKKVIFALLILLTIFSIYLAVAESSDSAVCLINSENSNCQTVQSSKYGKILDFKVSNLGAIAITILLLTYLLANKKGKHQKRFHKSYILFTTIGALFALYFLYIQFFIIKQICSTCLVIDNTIILISVLSYIDFKRR